MTQSNASFMSMELPSGQTDDYFKESMTANRVFSYAETTANQGSPISSTYDDATTKASISDVTGMRMESDSWQQKALDKLTEQHRQEAKQAAQVIEVQRQEIEQSKAQQLEDIANRSREILMAQAKVDEQDGATRQLRQNRCRRNTK
jgi:hypothetical protein